MIIWSRRLCRIESAPTPSTPRTAWDSFSPSRRTTLPSTCTATRLWPRLSTTNLWPSPPVPPSSPSRPPGTRWGSPRHSRRCIFTRINPSCKPSPEEPITSIKVHPLKRWCTLSWETQSSDVLPCTLSLETQSSELSVTISLTIRYNIIYNIYNTIYYNVK